MGSSQAATTAKNTPQVLVVKRPDGVREIHFAEPLTSVGTYGADTHTHDYRVKEAGEARIGNAAAYTLFWHLNGIPGLETATAEYRKVTLTFGLVYLADSTLWEEVKAALENAIKKYLNHDAPRILWH